MSRLFDIDRFYKLIDRIENLSGGLKYLHKQPIDPCSQRGVYFFFEPGESRSDSGPGRRLVRIGTHALGLGAKSTLKQRLRQHAGLKSGGGNHRGSIFRLLVGEALQKRGDYTACRSWGVKADLNKASVALGINKAEIASAESSIEQAVSAYLIRMPYLWLAVEDAPGPSSARATIERNAIALLSNYGRSPIDPPSTGWLGLVSGRERVRESGLWNQRHVDDVYDPVFLDLFEELIGKH